MNVKQTRQKDLGIKATGESSGKFAAAHHDEAPPLIAVDNAEMTPAPEFGAQIAALYPDATWNSYLDNTFGHTFEYPEQRRVTFWDEEDFMGSVDGYSWQEQIWDGEHWNTLASSDEAVSATELQHKIASHYAVGHLRP